MPKNFYLNNRNGVRSSRVDHLKSKQAIGAAPLHVRLTYSFRIEKAFHHSLSIAEVGTWGGGPSPNPSPVGRGVKCEVTPTRLPVRGITKPTSTQ